MVRVAGYNDRAGIQQALDLGLGTRPGRQLEDLGEDRVGVGDRQPSRGVAAVVQARRPQAGHHGGVEGRVVLGMHGVQGDAHEGRLDHRLGGEGGVQAGRVEAVEPVPQGEVGRRGLLGLEGDDAANGVGARLVTTAWTFINTELASHLFERPTGEWTGIEAESSIGAEGVGLSQAVVHDERGPVGRIAQSLLVSPLRS